MCTDVGVEKENQEVWKKTMKGRLKQIKIEKLRKKIFEVLSAN